MSSSKTYDMKIICVTGCLGFIPSYFVEKCLKRGWMVCGIDKITYAANEHFLEKIKKYKNFLFSYKVLMLILKLKQKNKKY